MSFHTELLKSHYTKLTDWSLLYVSGSDCENFLQGQLTCDVKKLKDQTSCAAARLDINGRLKFGFHLYKKNSHTFIFMAKKSLLEALREDLDKYIIMEDVDFEEGATELFYYWGAESLRCLDSLNISSKLFCNLFGVVGYVLTEETIRESHSIEKVDFCDLARLRLLTGYPYFQVDAFEGQLLNETLYNSVATSYSKGCFLGQETAAKIETRKGASKYPVVFLNEKSVDLQRGASVFVESKKIGTFLDQAVYDTRSLWELSLAREYRVEESKLTISFENGERACGCVRNFPLYNVDTREALAELLFECASKKYTHENLVNEAITWLELATYLAPKHSAAYESLAVILGNQGEYQKAIKLMDDLELKDPDNVMVNTNKSIFYMKLGEIESAEKEKEVATLKSFKFYGKQAQDKKAEEEHEKKKREDQARRERMYREVLDIDPDDSLANYGLGLIYFERELFEDAIPMFELAINTDKNYSVAYLALGKCLEAKGNRETAKKIYTEGVKIASRKGDLMPANEMQSRLLKI